MLNLILARRSGSCQRSQCIQEVWQLPLRPKSRMDEALGQSTSLVAPVNRLLEIVLVPSEIVLVLAIDSIDMPLLLCSAL